MAQPSAGSDTVRRTLEEWTRLAAQIRTEGPLTVAQAADAEGVSPIIVRRWVFEGVIRPIAMEFCIPYTIGRGYASLDPRYKMSRRFARSRKDRLVVLFLSDLDPEGQDICESFARSMRDEFGIQHLTAIKVGFNPDQISELGLVPRMKAKAKSSRRKRFVQRFGEDVFELESVPPDRLRQMLRSAAMSVIEMDLFRTEQRHGKDDAANLERLRRGFQAFATSFDLGKLSDMSDSGD